MGKTKTPKVKKTRAPRIKRAPKSPLVKGDYHVSLTCGEDVYEGSGDSVIDAFQAMPLRPKVLSKGMLRVSHGEKKLERLLYPNQVRKVLGFRIQRAIWAKLFSYGL